ncbi:MAG TPA: hypothetical protein VHD76_15545 [Bryobacteraceae bacterium]|nr:hypothetical protein [Bryobacteraceae bacterium]
MRNLLILLAAGGMLAAPAFADTLNGTISDSKCGAKHEAATEADAKCAQGCVKKGAEPVLVSEGKVLKIAADSKEKVADLVGKKVTITGTVDDDVVTIEDAKAAE